jgi:hypothetical protein
MIVIPDMPEFGESAGKPINTKELRGVEVTWSAYSTKPCYFLWKKKVSLTKGTSFRELKKALAGISKVDSVTITGVGVLKYKKGHTDEVIFKGVYKEDELGGDLLSLEQGQITFDVISIGNN